jgi:hypothetical protein
MVSMNQYCVEMATAASLQRVTPDDETLGIWNGDELVWKTSSIPGITALKTLWRYGRDIMRLKVAAFYWFFPSRPQRYT